MNQPSNVFVALEIKQQKTARIFVKQPLIKIAAMIVLVHITKYSNIFVRNLRIFEYIRTLTFQWSEYSNIFVFQFLYIRIRISNIRPKIFKYSNIFEYSLRSVLRTRITFVQGVLQKRIPFSKYNISVFSKIVQL